ncbi:MAG: glycosyltransferase [Mesorhizobium sp.]|uniref:glycosyltransferase n=2 Tax=Mesorhizobium sp. TaxID=1871066 RepID=UPI000FE4E553|nr:glycosyltransferase [Mesorhizobium sp.]RWI29870.1 MAG: glycosyltransferase [Mesorhizobium sp.]RWK50382.1 MAG: glycosyltransferase [Mesorhizobium sp.]RWK98242.1 MAG: glycosyltransferase [Mesorhizobium sp.]TIQ00920.1 MAG: glycosyltransferase [Mesorhizobium sp.]TIQ98510.1 MAG: glycosyltransferase [Mesorhizobium sp.]
MNVVQIIGGALNSGAGRGTRAVHEALLKEGIRSRILGRVEPDLPEDLCARRVPLLQRIPVGVKNRLYMWYLMRRFGEIPASFHPISHGLRLHNSPEYRQADVIHIQWAHAPTLGPAFWRSIRRERRPVVWTLRDMWPFTGGCHFSGTCEKYASGCGQCPILGGGEETITSEDVAFKVKHYGPQSVFVAISETIAEQARKSTVLRERDIRVIPNSVEMSQLRAMDKAQARSALGLPANKFVIASGALNLADPRKGADIMRHILSVYRDDKNVHWCLFGKGLAELVDPVPENCTGFGLIRDDVILNQIYSAADVFVMPSLQESFGKVTVEAMACGTPVIGLVKTPAEEIISHGQTGWLVKHGDAGAVVAAVETARALPVSSLQNFGLRARAAVIDRYSPEAIARLHIDLYESLLRDNQA